ncbi:MAG: alginate lyase family protein [Sarcina sp.]
MFEVLNLNYPGLENIKKQYNLGNIEEAKKQLLLYFKSRKSIKGYTGFQKIKLREIVLNDYIDEFIEIKKNSDKFLNGEISFDMKWDMERCKIPYFFENEFKWDLIPFGDEEWTYMLNRHKHWLNYGQSYIITENEVYAKAFVSELRDWILKNPITKNNKKLVWRTIEAGIRCKNWVKTFEYFISSDFFDLEILENFLVSLDNHMNYIIESSRNDRFLSNWVILENHGLFIASMFFPELIKSDERIKFALKYIENALDMQILRDGMHWEQSFMYHNEMINCIIDMIIIAKRNNFDIGKKIYRKLNLMAKATESFMEPGFTQGNYGDSDKEDLKDILAIASVVLNKETFKYGINKLPIENLFSLGIDGVDKFKGLKSKEKNYTSVANFDAGNYILRNGWNKDSTYTFFKCGSLGSGHGHYDLLHFHINYKSEDVIVDSGRYNYSEDNKYRVLLKKAISHNTFTLDDEEFSIAKGSWGSNTVATVVKRPHSFGIVADLVEGGHLGYINKGAFVNRKLIYVKNKFWIVSDEIFSNNSHKYKAYFNFNEDKIILNQEGSRVVGSYHLKNGIFKVIPLDNQKLSLEKAYISKEYNEIYNSKKIVSELEIEGNTTLNTLLSVDENNNIEEVSYLDIFDWQGKLLDKKYSKAIKVKFKEESYIVLIVNQEEPSGRKTYKIDDNIIYGRVAIIKEDKEGKNIEILSY